MFRKTVIAIAATAALAAAALPSTASAKKWHKHHHGFYAGAIGIGLIGAGLASTCYRYQWVETRYGFRKVLVNVCDY